MYTKAMLVLVLVLGVSPARGDDDGGGEGEAGCRRDADGDAGMPAAAGRAPDPGIAAGDPREDAADCALHARRPRAHHRSPPPNSHHLSQPPPAFSCCIGFLDSFRLLSRMDRSGTENAGEGVLGEKGRTISLTGNFAACTVSDSRPN